jgi:hypothetical protein
MVRHGFPTSQGELIKAARGEMTQAAFADEVGVDRSCLSRYERETLGAPTKLLNFCLRAVAQQMGDEVANESGLRKALRHMHQAVDELEALRYEDDKSRSRK